VSSNGLLRPSSLHPWRNRFLNWNFSHRLPTLIMCPLFLPLAFLRVPRFLWSIHEKFVFWFGIFGLGLVVFSLSFSGVSCPPGPESGRKAITDTIIHGLRISCMGYKDEYGSYPASSENYRLVSILRGENPRHIVFFEFNPTKDLNANGEAIDAWKTPLRITFLPVEIFIESAGPDRLFKTKDDRTSR
jgi:hypothetical protein